MSSVTITDWLIILAIILGPIIAVQLTKYIDSKKEDTKRKLDIFKTLMSTRAYTISWEHVKALNTIDLEFNNSNPKEKEVLNAWKAYLHLLGSDSTTASWREQRVELLADLLHKMAIVLSYDFDKTHIKTSSYSPVAHADIEDEQLIIRRGVIEMLQGKKSLPMHITQLPKNDDDSKNH